MLNRGRILTEQVWIFGGITRGNIEGCFMEIVDDRSRARLIVVLRRRIKPGIKIMSDCWKRYLNLEENLHDLFVTHHTVNHSKNFLDSNDPDINTQTIELFWSSFKRFVRRKAGTQIAKNFEIHYCEMLYRKKKRTWSL